MSRAVKKRVISIKLYKCNTYTISIIGRYWLFVGVLCTKLCSKIRHGLMGEY